MLTLGLNRAMELLAKARAKVRFVGPHPKDGSPVEIRKGRFGPYAQHGKMVANLPRNLVMEDATLEETVALLAEKGKELVPKGKGAKGKGKAAKPAAKADAAKANGAEPAPAKPTPRKAAAKPAARKPAAAAAKKPAAKAKPAAPKAPARKPAAKA